MTETIIITHAKSVFSPAPWHGMASRSMAARDVTDKAEKALDGGVSKAKGFFGGLKDMLK